MATLSVCMIMKNEEDVCERVLQSVRPFADEIIVADTGSSDATAEIAEVNGAQVFPCQWTDNFAAARNYSFSRASGDYLFWLDADDVVPEPSAKKISAAKMKEFDHADVLLLPYHLSFYPDGSPSFSIVRERILRRCPLAEWQGAVHEVIQPFGRIICLDAPVEHRKLHPTAPGRNLHIYEKLLEKGAILSEREQFYYARELSDNHRFEEAEPIFFRLLSIMPASSPDRGQLCRSLAACRDAAGDSDGALRCLLLALENGCPSSVTCCELGKRYLDKGLYAVAAEWYLRAMTDGSSVSETFERLDCHNFIPCIQLCLCFDKLGKYPEAEQWNRRAALYRPQDAAVLHNAAYFAQKCS